MHSLVTENEWIKIALNKLIIKSVSDQFPSLSNESEITIGEIPVKSLISLASIIAKENDPYLEDISFRIAQFAIQNGDEPDQEAACIIFDKMANRQSIKLAKGKDSLDQIRSGLPLPLKWDWIRRDLTFKEVLSDGTIIDLNRFQLDLWESLQTKKWLSVSAPTSSGKSFLLTKWMKEYINSDSTTMTVFLVPTRALIKQTETILKSEFQNHEDVTISSIPSPSQIVKTPHTVLVFTQERLQLLQGMSEIKINLLVVDEAQKMGDLNRGILLHQVIEQAMASNNELSTVFLSPLTENPEFLLSVLGQNPDNSINSNHVAVNQNLIWVSPVKRKPFIWTIDLCRDGGRLRLGTIQLENRPNAQMKKIAFISDSLTGSEGGSVVYVNRASDAEKVSVLLKGLNNKSNPIDPRIVELQKLIRKVIHKDYVLATVLEHGIGFHYGNMPLLIKEEVEELFKLGVIKFLVCTSTLIEGVNLPCKSIFLMGPKKGIGNFMKEDDFWNLAGRAGRLGHEFQGNVFCIDPLNESLWPNKAPSSRKKFKLTSSVKETIMNHESFVNYLKQDTPRSEKEYQKFDSLLSFLISYKVAHGTIKTNPALNDVAPDISGEIESEIERCLSAAQIPDEVIYRNPGISPLAMRSLLNYFENYEKGVENLAPLYPEEEDAVQSYIAVLSRINKTIGSVFVPAVRHAYLIVDWMRGYPLSRLISKRIELFGETESVPSIIRTTMDDVENVARFKGPKFIGCYTDLLQFFYNQKGIDQNVSDVRLWLEFGASSKTQISIMALGISRTAAVELADSIPSDELTEDGVLKWLVENPIEQLGLPTLVVNDVKRTIQLGRKDVK